jgi:monothiol glutaredoxin
MPKRQALSEITDWQTLPKVFIGGQFMGDTDILGPMADSGELRKLLEKTFADSGVTPTIQLR